MSDERSDRTSQLGHLQVAGSEPSGAAAFIGPVFTVLINGVRLGYRQFGRGPDLLLVTGDTAPMSLWTPDLLRRLAGTFRVTIFDNRGMGQSTDDPAVSLSIELMAQDTGALIASLDLEDVTLVGWSMGAEIALTMAALDIGATNVGRIVSSGGDAGSTNTVVPSDDLLARLSDPATSTDAGLELMFPATPAGQAAEVDFINGLADVAQDEPTPEILSRQGDAEADFLETSVVWDRLGDIRIPVLLTNGELDPGVSVVNAEQIAARIPEAELSIFEGAGHGMMFQCAERFASEVADFHRRTSVA